MKSALVSRLGGRPMTRMHGAHGGGAAGFASEREDGPDRPVATGSDEVRALQRAFRDDAVTGGLLEPIPNLGEI